MKTQLLEDIGQSATLSLVPSDGITNSEPYKREQGAVQEPAATPARPRSAFGVWRRKPDDAPVVLAPQPPDQLPPLPIAAVEAQQMPPQPVQDAAIASIAPASEGPMFDFTPPSPTTPELDLFKREPTWFERSGQRYLLWGVCLLSGVLLIQAGRWIYKERQDADALALVADKAKAEPQFDKAVKRRAAGVKEFTLSPDGEVVPVSPPGPRPRTASTVPPLVLLKPEPAADTKVKPTATPRADREELRAPRKHERVAEQAPAAPLPKAIHRTGRAPDHSAEREPATQAVNRPEPKPEPESAMSATLKACREHGYHATQCIEHKCSVTKYGFVCRGK